MKYIWLKSSTDIDDTLSHIGFEITPEFPSLQILNSDPTTNYILVPCAFSVVVIVIKNGISDSGSNSGRNCV